MSKTNEQGLTASQQEILLVWAGHIEATIAHTSEYESLVSLGFATRSVHPVTLEMSYRPTPAGIVVSRTIATLRAKAEALAIAIEGIKGLAEECDSEGLDGAVEWLHEILAALGQPVQASAGGE